MLVVCIVCNTKLVLLYPHDDTEVTKQNYEKKRAWLTSYEQFELKTLKEDMNQ